MDTDKIPINANPIAGINSRCFKKSAAAWTTTFQLPPDLKTLSPDISRNAFAQRVNNLYFSNSP